MPFHRAAALIILSLLVLAAPAAASERSEARRYATALEPSIALTPEQGEALVADYEARSAHVAATCLPAVRAAAKKDVRALTVLLLYLPHAFAASYGQVETWLQAGDDTLAAIPTRSRLLRRGRAARRVYTEFIGRMLAATPQDFCAVMTAWQAKRFKGVPPGAEALFEQFAEPSDRADRDLGRAVKRLKHHGATRAQRLAFSGEPDWPELRQPGEDPVLGALDMAPERAEPGEGGGRTPW